MGKPTLEKIEAIKKLVENQPNQELPKGVDGLLDEVYAILKSSSNQTEREQLLESIRKGEEDIKHGRVYTPEQVLERLHKRFKK